MGKSTNHGGKDSRVLMTLYRVMKYFEDNPDKILGKSIISSDCAVSIKTIDSYLAFLVKIEHISYSQTYKGFNRYVYRDESIVSSDERYSDGFNAGFKMSQEIKD